MVPDDDYGLYAIDILDPSPVRIFMIPKKFFFSGRTMKRPFDFSTEQIELLWSFSVLVEFG